MNKQTNLKSLAKDLPCIFSCLFEKYEQEGLRKCETKESQTWRHASGSKAANRLALFYDFFPELSSLKNSLTSYSICESHYNQIITTDQLYNSLLEQDKEYDNSMDVDEIQINSGFNI
jgi:hypothetical protein